MKRIISTAFALLMIAKAPAFALGAFPSMPTFWPEEPTEKISQIVSRAAATKGAAPIKSRIDR